MSSLSFEDSSSIVDNIVDLPYCDNERVAGFLRSRFLNGRNYTWMGNVLVCVQPFRDVTLKDLQDSRPNTSNTKTEASVEALIDRVLFRLNHEIGKCDQIIVVSGDSGSGKTHSINLAIRNIAVMQMKGSEEETILKQAWASVPLLNAFGCAPTLLNFKSSRFGKLLRLQYFDGKLSGAMLDTYLLEKTRVANVNKGEGNFHIFRQILDCLNVNQLTALKLNPLTQYKIAPKPIKDHQQQGYDDTIKAMKILNIIEHDEILKILSVILNLGNVFFKENFSCHGDGDGNTLDTENITITLESQKYLCNVASLLDIDSGELASVLCTVQFAHRGSESIFKSPCRTISECEARRDGIMKHLYEKLFRWLVNSINLQIFQGGRGQHINLLDLYGFEVFDHNSFEQLCINYVNERMLHYYTKNYLIQERKELIAEGYQVDALEDHETFTRITMIDGAISIFGILNEECTMKRFKSNQHLHTRLGHTFRSHNNFILGDEQECSFSIRHYAAVVKYESGTMIRKNMDKVPLDLIRFLKSGGFYFVRRLLDDDKDHLGNSRRTVASYFKSSMDQLVHVMDKCDVHYVKCLKPNNIGDAELFDHDYFVKQLRCNGVFEIIKLSFQNYPIKMDVKKFVRKIGYPIHEYLNQILGSDMHLSKQFVFLTKDSYFLCQRFSFCRMNVAAQVLQICWLKYMRKKHKAACIIQRAFRRKRNKYKNRGFNDSKRNIVFQSSLNANEDDGLFIDNKNAVQKVEYYLQTNSVEVNKEGMPLSLQLDKTFNKTATKKFKRVLYVGDGVISYTKLVELPKGFHRQKINNRYSYLLPRPIESKGLNDLFQ